MNDREEKLMELLKETGMLEIEDCLYIAEHLTTHGVAVKEPQKPMTVEELFLLPDVVYLECSYFDEVYAALPERYDKQTIDLMMRDECHRFVLKGYGKTRRCWAKRPTEEERKAAEWEE